MYDIGLSTCGKVINEELFKNCHKAGIGAIEISPKPEECESIDLKNVKAWSEKYGVSLWSFHLPFQPFSEIDISNKSICKNSVDYFEKLIKKYSDIGIERFIVHPSGEPIQDSERSERLECAKESLADLAEIAKREGAVIAVEDLPRTCIGKNSDEIEQLVSVHENLAVCFDTNHLLNENPVDFIHRMGRRIITTHVSDYDFINERHWLPGEGRLDWQAILQALKKVGYNGVWLYEIEFCATRTIIRDRDLTCDDFARNARELFENKAITVLGTPKENI